MHSESPREFAVRHARHHRHGLFSSRRHDRHGLFRHGPSYSCPVIGSGSSWRRMLKYDSSANATPISSMPSNSARPGCSPSWIQEEMMAMTGMPSDERLVVPAGSRCRTYSQDNQPMPVAITPLNMVTATKVFDQTMGGRSNVNWKMMTGIKPMIICQKVNPSGSTFARLCSRFAYTTPIAQHMPAMTASVLLNSEVCICQGSST